MAAKKAKPDVAMVEVRTPNKAGYVGRVQKDKYDAMRKALLKVLPRKSPGLTQSEMFERVVAHLPEALFPDGATAPWWVKCVQLDLEAQGVLSREDAKPIRWLRKP